MLGNQAIERRLVIVEPRLDNSKGTSCLEGNLIKFYRPELTSIIASDDDRELIEHSIII